MNTDNEPLVNPEPQPALPAPIGSAPMSRSALQFKIGDRLYWISRARDGHAWTIVANGDLVEHASILHYGDVEAFLKICRRLQEIENLWAARQIASAPNDQAHA
jgi:hypothetical protein